MFSASAGAKYNHFRKALFITVCFRPREFRMENKKKKKNNIISTVETFDVNNNIIAFRYSIFFFSFIAAEFRIF